jgi:hypothetical protein
MISDVGQHGMELFYKVASFIADATRAVLKSQISFAKVASKH